MKVSFVHGLKARAARVEDADADKLVRRMLAEYGTAQLYEWYRASTIGQVVFDVDAKTSETTAPALLDAAIAGVAAFFDGELPDHLTIAASHGLGPGHTNGDKLSYRIFVHGVRARMSDIKARLVRLNLDKNRPFDAAIYGAQQKLRMVGSIKTPDDRRPLKLVDRQGVEIAPTADLLLATLVQVVEDEWPLLQEPSELPGSKRPTASVEATHQQLAVSVSTDAKPPKRVRGRPPKDTSIPPEILRVLTAMQFVDPRFVSATTEGFVFDARNRDSCPNCSLDHSRQNWWCIPKPNEYLVGNYSDRCKVKSYPKTVETIVPQHTNFEDSLALLPLEDDQADKLRRSALHFHETVVKVACYKPECLACDSHHDCNTYTAMQLLPRHCWSVRNDDNSCPGRIFHHSAQLGATLKRLFMAPNDEALVGLFLEGHRAGIHVDRESETTYFWESAASGGGRWRQVSNVEFDSHLSGWLNALLYGVAMLPEFKDARKALDKALSKAQAGNIRNLRHLVEGRLSLQGAQSGGLGRMDANPYLLGAGTSVIELKAVDPNTGKHTTMTRLARPEDLVTKSIGYDIPDSPPDTAPVEAVFAQIYPVEEERRFFQLFGGYCLLGKAPAKGFLCLTDRRKGDNGKSTAVRLLRSALGDDYVIDNKQNLLYEARFASGVNAHDSGMMAFEGKRLALMEELSASRALDTSFLKQITGGETCISVRAANSATTRAMPWSAKLITVFNEGCAPRFKVEDEAFTKRMIVMPHRSLFCKNEMMWAAHNTESDTYKADGNKIDELQPAAILAWFLRGLERYWGSGQVEFAVPPACREWAGDLVQEQDAFKSWAEDNLTLGGQDDFVVKKEVEARARAGGLPLAPQQLKKRMDSLYAPHGVHCKPQHCADGVRHRSAWMKLKWT